MKKIGIYGGTFNPPHIGHVRAAESFRQSLPLDELLIIPDFLPPHKNLSGSITPEDRLNMCRLAFSHIDGAVISDMEIKRGGKSYTALTLKELSGPERELYFLCGTDMFLTLEEWYHPEEIFRLAYICVVRRESNVSITEAIEEHRKIYVEKYGAKIILIDSETLEISSTDLRNELKNSNSANKYLSKNVNNYILEKGLYK